MKKLGFSICLAFLLVGCGNDKIDMVKNAVVEEIDDTATIGDIIDTYKGCDSGVNWNFFVTDRGREYVEATCDMSSGYKKALKEQLKDQNELSNKLKETISSINNIEKEIKKLENSLKETKEIELADMRDKIKKLEAKGVTLKAEFDKITKEIQKENSNSKNTENKVLNELVKKRDYLINQIENLTAEETIADDKVFEISEFIATANEEIIKNESELRQLNRNIKYFKAQKLRYKEIIEKTEKEKKFIKEAKMRLVVQFVLPKTGGYRLAYAAVEKNNPQNIKVMNNQGIDPIIVFKSLYND